jgi:cell division protein FtsL
MSPVAQSRSKKITAADNLYTVILAVAFFAVLATAVFVAYQCYTQYGTIFNMQ